MPNFQLYTAHSRKFFGSRYASNFYTLSITTVSNQKSLKVCFSFSALSAAQKEPEIYDRCIVFNRVHQGSIHLENISKK